MAKTSPIDLYERPEPRRKSDFSNDLQMDESTNEGAPDHNIGELHVAATGEGGEDAVPGGWQGTDDANSTAPSDMAGFENPNALDSPEGAAMHVESYAGELSDLSDEDAERVGSSPILTQNADSSRF